MKNFVQYIRASFARTASTLASVFAILITAAALMLSTQSIAATVTEFYNINLDHYFITSDANEAAAIDNGSAGPGWSRTGNTFYSGGTTTVCRFYGSQSPGPNSHFYTADPTECLWLQQLQAATPATEKRWNFESLDFVSTPSVNQTCQSGTVPIYRAYNNGFARGVDSNHRITSNVDAIDDVLARGWIDEGVVMCAPASACTAPAVWTSGVNACVYPIGVKVSGANQLPTGCLSWKDQCWRDAVANGTVKWVSTPAVTTGVNNRPIVFAYFINASTPSPTNGIYSFVMFYADTGESLGNEINNGIIDEMDWVYGTTKGLVQHYKSINGNSYCGEMSWYPPTTQPSVNSNIWANVPVTCPVQ